MLGAGAEANQSSATIPSPGPPPGPPPAVGAQFEGFYYARGGERVLGRPIAPAEPVNYLNRMFSAFDDLAEKYGLEKIKTIGDAYMVAGGFPEKRACHAQDVSAMALEMLEVVERQNDGVHQPVSIRIGIHTGPAVAGAVVEGSS